MRILVVNAGSSSLKLSVLDGDRQVTMAALPAEGGTLDTAAIAGFVGDAGALDAVGHRIVHGGTDFTGATVVDALVRRRLEALTDLAPLHQPASLEALEAVSRLLPEVPAVACFDTAFHAAIPAAAATYALPVEWRRRWPLRRFGFHGLSHAYVARRAPELLGRPAEGLRIVSCHLGAGASVTAIRDGVSVDTTMGFTPLEGLVMATRSGTVDPGLVLWLEEHAGMPPAELAATLEHRSGLLGLAGSGDLRVILEAEAAGDQDAVLALGVYLHRLRAAIASMAAAMDGLDALVFTGGVGEHAAPVRERAAAGLRFLGVDVDAEHNVSAEPDRDISLAGAPTRTLVVRTREDLQIAMEVERLSGAGAG
ncbi:MAG TPA: acetate/propionate family kinase [Acidimicrobiales bacterium]|nr:acetate/propionate family kinase [Acidimicrobiales bacterium]